MSEKESLESSPRDSLPNSVANSEEDDMVRERSHMRDKSGVSSEHVGLENRSDAQDMTVANDSDNVTEACVATLIRLRSKFGALNGTLDLYTQFESLTFQDDKMIWASLAHLYLREIKTAMEAVVNGAQDQGKISEEQYAFMKQRFLYRAAAKIERVKGEDWSRFPVWDIDKGDIEWSTTETADRNGGQDCKGHKSYTTCTSKYPEGVDITTKAVIASAIIRKARASKAATAKGRVSEKSPKIQSENLLREPTTPMAELGGKSAPNMPPPKQETEELLRRATQTSLSHDANTKATASSMLARTGNLKRCTTMHTMNQPGRSSKQLSRPTVMVPTPQIILSKGDTSAERTGQWEKDVRGLVDKAWASSTDTVAACHMVVENTLLGELKAAMRGWEEESERDIQMMKGILWEKLQAQLSGEGSSQN